jgi:hypothetical protein
MRGDQWRFPTTASGQLAVGVARRHPGRARYAAEALEVFTLEGETIKDITAYAIPPLFRHFGLPDELASARH